MGNAFYPGWQAGLEVAMDRRGDRTRLSRVRHWGPLRVQRPFHPGGNGECHLYVLHPPGGMVTGDQLDIDVTIGDRGHGLITTPSAGKLYRGNQSSVAQYQKVRCAVSGAGYLEWLPQETIVFDGARGELDLVVELDDESRACLWDIVCLGRPASGERFTHGYLNQRVLVSREGKLLYRESNRFRGGSELLERPWGLAGNTVSGTFLATLSLTGNALEEIRRCLEESGEGNCMAAVSDLGGIVAVRYLGRSAEQCRRLFTACWRLIRPLINGDEIIEPRIWRT